MKVYILIKEVHMECKSLSIPTEDTDTSARKVFEKVADAVHYVENFDYIEDGYDPAWVDRNYGESESYFWIDDGNLVLCTVVVFNWKDAGGTTRITWSIKEMELE